MLTLGVTVSSAEALSLSDADCDTVAEPDAPMLTLTLALALVLIEGELDAVTAPLTDATSLALMRGLEDAERMALNDCGADTLQLRDTLTCALRVALTLSDTREIEVLLELAEAQELTLFEGASDKDATADIRELGEEDALC